MKSVGPKHSIASFQLFQRHPIALMDLHKSAGLTIFFWGLEKLAKVREYSPLHMPTSPHRMEWEATACVEL